MEIINSEHLKITLKGTRTVVADVFIGKTSNIIEIRKILETFLGERVYLMEIIQTDDEGHYWVAKLTPVN